MTDGLVLCAVLTLIAFATGGVIGYRVGRKLGQRLEIAAMIELLNALKIDCYEQRVFKDRFQAGLQWVLDGKRKGDRNATENGPAES